MRAARRSRVESAPLAGGWFGAAKDKGLESHELHALASADAGFQGIALMSLAGQLQQLSI